MGSGMDTAHITMQVVQSIRENGRMIRRRATVSTPPKTEGGMLGFGTRTEWLTNFESSIKVRYLKLKKESHN